MTPAPAEREPTQPCTGETPVVLVMTTFFGSCCASSAGGAWAAAVAGLSSFFAFEAVFVFAGICFLAAAGFSTVLVFVVVLLCVIVWSFVFVMVFVLVTTSFVCFSTTFVAAAAGLWPLLLSAPLPFEEVSLPESLSPASESVAPVLPASDLLIFLKLYRVSPFRKRHRRQGPGKPVLLKSCLKIRLSFAICIRRFWNLYMC